MIRTAVSILVMLMSGCVASDVATRPGPHFPGPYESGITDAKMDAAAQTRGGGGYGVLKDQSGIAWPPAIALFEPAYPKPSFVQPDDLANRTAPPEPNRTATVYPTRGQAAQSTNSPTLYPPSGRFNTEPGNPSLYPRGPLAPRGFRGQ